MKDLKNKNAIKASSGGSFIKYLLLFFISVFSMNFANAQDNSIDSSTTFKVYGECIQCKNRIETALKIKGVQSADWNVATKMLNVVYDPSVIHLQQIKSQILSAGHDLEDQKAKDEIYNALQAN